MTGYSEVRCWFCAVSFNIGRFRTIDEPHSYGWENGAMGWDEENCEFNGGCFAAKKLMTDQNLRRMQEDAREDFENLETERRAEMDKEEGVIDGDFEPDGEDEDEELEFECDDEKVDIVMSDAADEEESEDEIEARRVYLEWAFDESIRTTGLKSRFRLRH